MNGKNLEPHRPHIKNSAAFFTSFCVYYSNAQTANFIMSLNEVCAPTTITFTDASSGGAVVSRSWNLGNGVTAGLPVVSANYGIPQTYSVTLTVNFSGGLTQNGNQTGNYTSKTYS